MILMHIYTFKDEMIEAYMRILEYICRDPYNQERLSWDY